MLTLQRSALTSTGGRTPFSIRLTVRMYTPGAKECSHDACDCRPCDRPAANIHRPDGRAAARQLPLLPHARTPHLAAVALSAARQALKASALSPADVTHLVTVSCTGFRAPGFDVDLIHGLELPDETERTHVGYMGCHGALNGLRVARALAGDNERTCVL